ncbi:proto-oncogene tyrosine-protein kinase ros, partial [Lasius niger]
MEIKRNCTKIIDIDSSADNLCIDWVARNLYWTTTGDNDENYIMKLDLTLWQQMGIAKYDKILQMDFSFLKVLPSAGYLYWWAYIWNKYKREYEYVIMKSNLNGKNIKPFFKNEDNEFCPYKQLGHDSLFMEIDTTNIDKPLIYWILKDSLFASDIFGWKCNLILTAENQTDFYDLAVDKINIYLYIKNYYQIYILNKKYALLESKENALKHVTKVNISLPYPDKLIVLNKSLQPYPPTICLTPNMKGYRVEEVNTTANSIVVSLPEPIPNGECEKYNLATTIYNISVNYLTCLDNDLKKLEEFNVQTHEQRYEFQNLTPFTEYTLKLALSNFYFDKLSMDLQFGADVKLTTKGKLNSPENVTVQVLTPTLAAVYWMPPKKLNCAAVKYQVHCMQLSNSTQAIIPETFRSTNPIDKPKRTLDGKFFTIIQSLLPKQKYKMHVSVLYSTVDINLFNDSLPKIVHMSIEPNNLILSGVSTNGMNISWIPSANLTIHTGLHYILEYKNNAMREWQIANNTEENNDKVTYYIENLLPRTLYNFRLILRYSEYMENFIWPPYGEFTFSTIGSIEIPAMQYYKPLIVSFFVNFVIYACFFYYSYRRRKESNKLVPKVEYDPELRHLLDEFALTFEKRQITLGEFLGSGAFGEVYQGTVKDFEGSETTPVAIKMLKNTSSQEKIKFLKEANRMSDFRHKHVLRLLGICVDTDSPWLILELMEAGDLLQYLRKSRALRPSDSQALRLQDLLAMCEDVARGCRYLEEQRFVHRDLACRNCLISGRNRKNRIVKIGDFGLARDIYTNDYYRMEGKTLLPVRWMAPEALKYQYFTSKSDVWAFGVLMWEITSLGLTPYYARNDIEVCIYVGAGGMLSKPLNCPSTLYQLMLSCWNAVNERPKFKLCLENIISLRDNIEDTILSSVDIIKRVQ